MTYTPTPPNALERDYADACAALKAIAGVGSGAAGLTPDAVKARPDYRAAKLAKDRAFAALRAFNRNRTRSGSLR